DDGTNGEHGCQYCCRCPGQDGPIAIDVEGMMCQNNCGSTVKRAIEAVPGVSRAEVSFAARRAWAWLSPSSSSNAAGRRQQHHAALGSSLDDVAGNGGVTAKRSEGEPEGGNSAAVFAEILEAVEAVGFGAEASPDVELLVGGMMCQRNCGTTVRNALLSVSPSVARAEASFEEGRGRIWIRAAASGLDGPGVGGGLVAGDNEADGSGGGGGGFLPEASSSDESAAVARLAVEELEAVGFDASLAPSAVLEIEGMMCQKSCGTTVRGCLEAVPGVDRAEVSYADGRLARVWARDGPRLPVSVLVEAVEDVGFGARVVRGPAEKDGGSGTSPAAEERRPSGVGGGAGEADTKLPKMLLEKEGGAGGGELAVGVFSVSGMSCASCVGNVEKFVSALDGVDDVRVALLAEKAEVRFDPGTTNGQELADGITGLGYPTRHLSSTVLTGAGAAGGKGVPGASDITVEVFGVSGPESVSNLEATVLALPGVASCKVTRTSTPGAGDGGTPRGGSYNESGGSPAYVLTATRHAPRNRARNKATGARREGPSGGDELAADVNLALEGGDGGRLSPASGSADELGGGGKGPGSDDAVWDALRSAFHSSGRRKHAGVRDVLEAVRGSGYEARAIAEGGGGTDANSMQASQAAEVAEWRRLLLLAVGFTVPVMILHMVDHADGSDGLCGGEASYGTLLSWVLVTVVQAVVGKRFYRNAYKSAKHWSFGMDMLVVVGTSVSYLYSSLALLLACSLPGDLGDHRPHLFLESPAMLLTFIALGKFLEVLAKRKTSQALVLLLSAQPHHAVLVEPLREDELAPSRSPSFEGSLGDTEAAVVGIEGFSKDDDDEKEKWRAKRATGWRETSVEASLVQPGDVLRVLPGSQFPTDGTLLSGQTYVDESMITGESSPVAKREGDAVCGGTANQHGSVLMRAERVGQETMLAQLCRLVEEAQMSKAPIQRQADRVAGVFVPAVIGASVATFLGWFIAGEAGLIPEDWLAEERSDSFLFALLFGVSVVVVACPCALGLATPTAVMVGTGVGAGNGVLIKGGAALEAAHRVNTVVFDKTGTLTRGKPFLTDVVPIRSPALERLLASAASPAATAANEAAAAPAAAPAAPGLGASPSATDATASAAAAAAGAATATAAVLALAAACEAYSEHPVGRAIVDAAAEDTGCDVAGMTKEQQPPPPPQQQQHQHQHQQQRYRQPLSPLPETRTSWTATAVTTDFVSEPGCGVACQHPVGRVCVGTRGWAESNGRKPGKVVLVVGNGDGKKESLEEADRIMKGLEEEGKTAVIVTVDGEAVGVVAVADTDKEGSRRAVLALDRMGLDVWVVTGDNRRVATALARRLGIAPERVMAEVLPAGKARKVQELQLAGGHVAMVGDGVNDAPALATADVGIAVGAGTQVAMEAADMVLVRSDVCDVVSALHLGRKVFGRIRLNFVFAMLYNLCGVPIAAGVLYPFLHIRLPPALAGLSMALSSISVVLSSLALRFYKKPEIDDEGRLWQRSAAATGLEVVSGCFGGVRHLARGRRSFAGGRGLRFHAVRDEVDYDDDDVEMQPRGGRGSGNISTASSGSSNGVVGGRSRWSVLSAIKKGSAIDSAPVFATRGAGRRSSASSAAAGPYALVRSHSRDGSVTSTSSVSGLMDRGEVNGGVEMMGFV
ncbi:unnamed protein product, partial [Ectocarpus sp. 6 AP-2014]